MLALIAFFTLMIYAGVSLMAANSTQTWADFIKHPNFAAVLIGFAKAISVLAIPLLLAFFPLYAAMRGVAVYEEFVEGAKEGFQVAVRIMPFLVGMLVAIGMLRGSGAITMVQNWLAPALNVIHFPPELVPLVLMRPLSGSGATGIFAELVKSFGPDSLITRTAGTIIGSTETTFYVLTVYFGAVAIKRARHAVVAGLMADLTGIIASVAICRLVFG